MYEKFKSLLSEDAFFYSILILLVGIVSFGLGRRSWETGGREIESHSLASVIITEAPADPSTSVVKEPAQPSITVVASRSGTKYHLLDCPGANQIKDDNKIFFDSVELAKAAGFQPAANCPGLK
ncbi:hypothetical protein KC865_04945 [Candidatus Kaiserbacteria bacterium]|nr:hypothetical protein [Candidatus Kaiserbacteria bacterium]USN92139.1 MAG: hypothetical protein H6782_04670 [Candidatus Nomurabacteria bacterium]